MFEFDDEGRINAAYSWGPNGMLHRFYNPKTATADVPNYLVENYKAKQKRLDERHSDYRGEFVNNYKRLIRGDFMGSKEQVDLELKPLDHVEYQRAVRKFVMEEMTESFDEIESLRYHIDSVKETLERKEKESRHFLNKHKEEYYEGMRCHLREMKCAYEYMVDNVKDLLDPDLYDSERYERHSQVYVQQESKRIKEQEAKKKAEEDAKKKVGDQPLFPLDEVGDQHR